MTRDDENPYRFVEAVEYEESVDLSPLVADEGAERWDLRAYVAPAEEPIYSPAEIAELGTRWSSLLFSTLLDLPIVSIAASLTVFEILTEGYESAALFLLIYSGLAVTGFRMLLWSEAHRLLLALRYPWGRSIFAAALYAVPIANLSLLFPLQTQTLAILRRHGIPIRFSRAPAESLPRRVDKKSGVGE